MANLEDVKKLLRSLLVSAPVKVTVQSLARDFQELEGYNIPYKELGYNSLIHLLHSIPDVLRVNGTSNFSEITLVVSEKTAHVSELVMKQRKPANRKKVPKKSVITNRIYPPNQRNYQRIPSKPTYRDNTAPIQQNQQPKINCQPCTSPYSLSPFPRPIFPILKTSPQLVKHVQNNTPRVSNVLNGKQPTINLRNDSPQSPKVAIIERKLAKLKLRKSIPSMFDSDSPKLNVTMSLRNETGVSMDDDTKIPVKLRENLRKIIIRHPLGIWCTDLDAEYELIYGQRIEYEKYGFLSLVNLCLTLEDIFTCKKESSCDYKLYDKHKPIPKIRTVNKEDFPIVTVNVDPSAIIPPGTTPDWDNYSNSIPEDALKLGEIVEKNILEQFDIDHETPIVISEISSAINFWMYKDDGLLDRMMNTMQRFYSENKAKYLIPEILLEVGLYCVVYLLEEYQRGIIVDITPNTGLVRVYFLDYGTLVYIPRSKIWFLTREFASLEWQSIRAELANIEPINSDWCPESCKCFKEFISGKRLIARIVKKVENKVTVYISDTGTPKKFVNDVLVDKGFANYIDKNSGVDQKILADKKKGLLKLLERVKQRKQLCDANRL